MSERSTLRALLGAATVLAGLAGGAPSSAAGTGDPVDTPVPPVPSLGQHDESIRAEFDPRNQQEPT